MTENKLEEEFKKVDREVQELNSKIKHLEDSLKNRIKQIINEQSGEQERGGAV